MRRFSKLILCLGAVFLAAGCPKSRKDYSQGRKAEHLQDYDAAYDYYQKALKNDPENAEYLIKFNQARFEASSLHVKNGVKLRERGQLEAAASEFQRAVAIDPSSPIAEQEFRKTVNAIEEKNRANNAATEPPRNEGTGEPPLASMPPELKPLPNTAISLSMTNDAKIVFETIAKLAGVTVIFDPDFPARRIPVQLNNVTLQQALDIVSLESKAFWKPVTENIIFVIPDQPAKRRDYEENIVRTFYLSNTVQAQDLTEVVTGLRQLLDLKRIFQINGQNAIVIRDSPDKLLVAEKMINDIDKAKPEVVIEVQVVEARVDKLRSLGIAPGQTASIAVVPPGTTTTTPTTNANGTPTTTNNAITLQNLGHLTGADYVVNLPSFTANALLNDSTTKIIQNPEVRSVDGQPAKLRIGDKVPIATGSFQAGVGVGGTAGTGFVNPLVNTQFQYQDVGVNVDITPRVHPNHEVSMKLSVEVSSVTGQSTIGGIQQPIISQRKIEHEIRLKEGEANVLGGLITRSDTKSINGWPGLARIPLLRYFFSEDTHNSEDDEILIILTPHIVRMPEWTRANLRPLYTGSESQVQVRRESEVRSPNSEQRPSPQQGGANSGQQAPGAATVPSAPGTSPTVPTSLGAATTVPSGTNAAQIRFEPRSLSLKVGQTQTIGVVVENVNDLFSIPFLLQYNPAVISVEEVQHGGFLSGGNQEIAIVCSGCGSNRNDQQHGQAIISATRQPNTAGVSGTGTIMGIVVKAIAPGSSNLSIVQVNAKDSQQKPIALVTGEATLQVQP
ncbi:MAG: type and secretion system protein [Candidatus Acidoferrum typicum]|nr:type and secretion system protein [Candidatus Acidoferrum typicum]